MRCYIRSKTLLYILLGILSLGFCLIKSENASAYSYYVDRPTGFGLQRSFINSSGDYIVGQNYTNINSYPQTLLAGNPLNYLLGFKFNAIDIRNNGYKTYNTVYFDTVIYANTAALGSAAYDTFDMSVRLMANNTFQHGTCEVSEVQSNYIRYHCVVAATANFKPDYLYVTFGNYNYKQGQIYWGHAVSQISVNYVGWGFDAQEDPNTAYLQQIAFQNQTIINQNNQIINGQQQIDDSVNHPDYIDEERQELEDTQDDAEESANSAGEDVENGTSSLTQTMGQVVNEIKNAQPTNCNITINPRAGQFEIGTINLCNAPANIRTMIETVVVVAVTLGVFRTCYSIFNQFMYYVRKEQE